MFASSATSSRRQAYIGGLKARAARAQETGKGLAAFHFIHHLSCYSQSYDKQALVRGYALFHTSKATA